MPDRDLSAEFEAEYARSGSPVMDEIETAVLGAAYGGTSYTTVAQADRLAALMGLGAGSRLLSLGAGGGWPGLYLAERTGCRAVLIDVPVAAAKAALSRIVGSPVRPRARVVVGDGAGLPFADGVFDAIEHSDVLC